MKRRNPDIDEMDGEDEQERADEPNYFFEEEKLFDMDMDMQVPIDDLIEKYGNIYGEKPKLGSKDPFDPQNWSF